MSSINNHHTKTKSRTIVIDIIQLFSSVGGGTCHFVPHSTNKVAHTLATSLTTRGVMVVICIAWTLFVVLFH